MKTANVYSTKVFMDWNNRHDWGFKNSKALIKLNFKQNEADPCVFNRNTESAFMILAVWLDVLLQI
jgi:hypothetical protein